MRRLTRELWGVAGLAAMLVVAGCAAEVDTTGEPAPAVTLQLDAIEDTVIEYRLTNGTDRTVRIARWRTPFSPSPDRFLEVTRNGEPVFYRGPLKMRLAPTADSFFALAPGESVRTEFDLRVAFDVDGGGEFEVRSGVPAELVVEDATAIATDFDSAHTIVEVVTGRGDGAAREVGLAASEVVTGCTQEQFNYLSFAAQIAAWVLSNATNTYMPGHARPNWYFGDNHDTVTVSNVLYGMYDILSDPNANYICKGWSDGCSDYNTVAYVDPVDVWLRRNNVQLCTPFFDSNELPGDTHTTSSAWGVLLHEYAHLAGAVWDQDLSFYAAVRDLALNAPHNAVRNADSYRYFVLNTENVH